MAIVGWVAVGLVGVAVLGALIVFLVTLPDIRRYLRMRRM